MITNIEHKEILNIVEKHGGDDKVALRNKIITLLRNHDRVIKGKFIKAVERLEF